MPDISTVKAVQIQSFFFHPTTIIIESLNYIQIKFEQVNFLINKIMQENMAGYYSG
jgi:hypothetical protein